MPFSSRFASRAPIARRIGLGAGLVVALALPTAAVADPAGPTVGFYPEAVPDVWSPIDVAIADVTGDGRPDLVHSGLPGSIVVAPRDASGDGWAGSFTVADFVSEEDVGEYRVAVADLDGDGQREIVSLSSGRGRLWVHSRTGGPDQWSRTLVLEQDAGGYHPQPLAVGDVTGDGRPDLLIAHPTLGAVRLVEQQADGGWAAPVLIDPTGPAPVALTIADVTGDGRPEVVGGLSDAMGVVVLEREPQSGAWTQSQIPVPGLVGDVAVGDATGDGLADIVAAAGDTIFVLGRSPAGGWTPEPGLASGLGSVTAVDVADVDDDGRADVVATGRTSDPAVGVLRRTADGTTWQPARTWTMPRPASSGGTGPSSGWSPSTSYGSVGDVTGDGRPEVVVPYRYFVSFPYSGAPRGMVQFTGTGDASAPQTVDDVPAAYRPGPVAVTLTADDGPQGTGVVATHYTTGVTPEAPTTASPRYDPNDPPRLADGERISYFSVDRAGNAEAPRTSAAVKVDSTVPSTTVTAPPPAVGADPRPAATFATGAPDATFGCAVDDGEFVPCASPFRAPARLEDGEHRYRIRATSRSGIAEPAPVELRFAVDTTAPGPPVLTGPPPASTFDRTVRIGFATEPDATAACAVDEGPSVPCTDPFVVSDLAPGEHTVAVTQTDRAGNRSAPLRVWFRVSATPTLLPAATPVTPRLSVLTGSSRDAAGRYPAVLLAGVANAACAEPTGQLRSCTVEARSTRSLRLPSGRTLPAGSVLARGASASQPLSGTERRVGLRLPTAGRRALGSRPLGITARAFTIATVDDGRAIQTSTLVRLMRSDTLVVPLSSRSPRLSPGNRRMLARLVRTVGNAATVRCAGFGDPRGDRALERTATTRQARAACDFLRRQGLTARSSVEGRGVAGAGPRRRLEITIRF